MPKTKRTDLSFSCSTKLADRGPGGSWCHLFLPAKASAFLGKRGQVGIVLEIEGLKYRATARPDGKGGHFVLFHSEMMTQTGHGAGDTISLEISLDQAPRTVETPPELVEAFESAPDAKAGYEAMPPSHQREHVGFILAAKKEETRKKRIAEAILMMAAWWAEHRGGRGAKPE